VALVGPRKEEYKCFVTAEQALHLFGDRRIRIVPTSRWFAPSAVSQMTSTRLRSSPAWLYFPWSRYTLPRLLRICPTSG
jgi:hypothetical protein